MANKVLRCVRECRLTNNLGLEEHYEDDVGQDLYEVSEERAAELMETGNFVPAPTDAVAHTSFVGATSPPPPAASRAVTSSSGNSSPSGASDSGGDTPDPGLS